MKVYVKNNRQQTLLLHYLYKYMGYEYDSLFKNKFNYWKFDTYGAIDIDPPIKIVYGGMIQLEEDTCDVSFRYFRDIIWEFDAQLMGVI